MNTPHSGWSLSVLANWTSLKFIARIYCILIGVHASILIVLISICLATRSKIFGLRGRLGKVWENLDSKKQVFIQRISWTVLIFSLIGGLGFFSLVLEGVLGVGGWREILEMNE